MGFQLKKVENEQQIAAMCQVAGQVWHLTYDPLLPPGQVDYMVEKFQSPHAVAEQMERERYQYHTLEEDGRVMGFVGFSPRYEGREEMFLSKVYMLPEFFCPRPGGGAGCVWPLSWWSGRPGVWAWSWSA